MTTKAELPCSGGRGSYWGEVIRWNAPDRRQAFGLTTDSSGGRASISSCFYLLVKYVELRTKDFICPSDAGTTEFKLCDVRNVPQDYQLADAWDFGWHASQHCSYAYHLPFGMYALSASSDPMMPVAADRNPWLNSPAGEPGPFALFQPGSVEAPELSEPARQGNSGSHNRDGQNVLFVDGHVSFEKHSDCGLDHDNIYTVSDRADGRAALGTRPVYGPSRPMNAKDSLLVHDPGPFTTAITHQAQEWDSKDLKQTVVVATLDCPLPEHKNAIWCCTFQMAWDKLKTDVIGEPIQVLAAEDLAIRLNRAAFPATDIEPQSYYANAGFVKNGILERDPEGHGEASSPPSRCPSLTTDTGSCPTSSWHMPI